MHSFENSFDFQHVKNAFKMCPFFVIKSFVSGFLKKWPAAVQMDTESTAVPHQMWAEPAK